MEFEQMKSRVSEATALFENQLEEQKAREAQELELLFPNHDAKIIDLESRLNAVEEKLRNEARTTRSIVPLLRAILAEIEGDGEINTATAELMELFREIRANEHLNIVWVLKGYIWWKDLPD